MKNIKQLQVQVKVNRYKNQNFRTVTNFNIRSLYSETIYFHLETISIRVYCRLHFEEKQKSLTKIGILLSICLNRCGYISYFIFVIMTDISDKVKMIIAAHKIQGTFTIMMKSLKVRQLIILHLTDNVKILSTAGLEVVATQLLAGWFSHEARISRNSNCNYFNTRYLRKRGVKQLFCHISRHLPDNLDKVIVLRKVRFCLEEKQLRMFQEYWFNGL